MPGESLGHFAILLCKIREAFREGEGKLGGVAYQFTTFEFTEPGARNLLYPRCDPNLRAWIKKKARKGGRKGYGQSKEMDLV